MDRRSSSDPSTTTAVPLHSQNLPDCEDQQHEPTSDNIRDSPMTFEPAPSGLNTTTMPEQCESDQVLEGVLVEYEGMEVSPAH